jgi:hypothetical protein
MSILALTSNTLVGTPGAGQIEYDGQFFGTDSNASRAQFQRLVLSTAVASTSGTSIDFTGLPAWVKRITVMLNGVSTNGTSNILIQSGSGSIDSTGYVSQAGNRGAESSSTAGFLVTNSNAAASLIGGSVVLTTLGSNVWVAAGTLNGANSVPNICAGYKTFSGTIDRIRITTVNGTDAFDAGSINIMYEG